MALSTYKDGIKALADRPTLTATQLKALFTKDDLIDELIALGADNMASYEKITTTDGYFLKFLDGTGFWYGSKAFVNVACTVAYGTFFTCSNITGVYTMFSVLTDNAPTAMKSISFSTNSDLLIGVQGYNPVVTAPHFQFIHPVSGNKTFTATYQMWGAWK